MKKIWWAAIGAVSMSAVAWAYPFWETSEGYVVPGVRVAGTEVGGLSRSELETLIESQNRACRQRVVYITHDRYRYPLQAAETGVRLDVSQTVKEILSYGRRGSLWQQWRERVWSRVSRPDIAPQVRYDASRIAAWVADFQQSVAEPAQNASLDWAMDGTVKVTQERPFFQFSAQRLQQDIETALPLMQTDEIPLRPDAVVLPTVTAQMLEEIDSLLGQYVTYFAEDGNRAANIRRAAAAIDQQIVPAGEWLSFNTQTGLRTEAQGYLPAPVFINGKLEPDFGGGVCQVSTTMFNSALLSGLDIVERTSHFAPVGYTEIGRDATVADHYLDLVIANAYTHPVCIVTRVGEGTLQIAVLGNHEDRPQDVELTQTQYRQIPHETVERVRSDPSVAGGREEGHDGYQVAWQRQVTWENGETKTDTFASYYEPVSTIVIMKAEEKARADVAQTERAAAAAAQSAGGTTESNEQNTTGSEKQNQE